MCLLSGLPLPAAPLELDKGSGPWQKKPRASRHSFPSKPRQAETVLQLAPPGSKKFRLAWRRQAIHRRAGGLCQASLVSITPILFPVPIYPWVHQTLMCPPGEKTQGLMKPGRLELVSLGTITSSLFKCQPCERAALLHTLVLIQ